MTNEHGQVFADWLVVEFNIHFYLMLKWILFIPFTIVVILLSGIIPHWGPGDVAVLGGKSAPLFSGI
jgi:hypothetical protein